MSRSRPGRVPEQPGRRSENKMSATLIQVSIRAPTGAGLSRTIVPVPPRTAECPVNTGIGRNGGIDLALLRNKIPLRQIIFRDIVRSVDLGIGSGKIKMHIIASDCNLYLDSDWPRMPDSRVIHIIRKNSYSPSGSSNPCLSLLPHNSEAHAYCPPADGHSGQSFRSDVLHRRGSRQSAPEDCRSALPECGCWPSGKSYPHLPHPFAYPDERNLKSFLENADRISGLC